MTDQRGTRAGIVMVPNQGLGSDRRALWQVPCLQNGMGRRSPHQAMGLVQYLFMYWPLSGSLDAPNHGSGCAGVDL